MKLTLSEEHHRLVRFAARTFNLPEWEVLLRAIRRYAKECPVEGEAPGEPTT